ncbi:acyl-CoA dehydrogenase family protein [Nocardia pseudovaccinii]|uniref:acyl-CoA dehydrogenase family protein n=1 Tax=Nocardia pseudovaccinii TaxID=189540 RepID=UPI003D92C61B
MSDDIHAEIRRTVDAMCSAAADRAMDSADSSETFDELLWTELSGTGFTLLGVPEQFGGSGGELDDLAVVVETVARHTAPVPLTETAFLAGWLLSGAGLTVPGSAPLTTTSQVLTADPDGSSVSGTVTAGWARYARHLVLPVDRAGELLIAVIPLGEPGDPSITPGANLAGEPRDTVIFDSYPLPQATAVAGCTQAAILARGALARTVQLAGAAHAVLAMSLQHAGERVQFGRPLTKFQAIQQGLATLAAEATRMHVSASAAVRAVQESAEGATLAVAAAKATNSASASVVAALGHQIHGALGFSREHRLGKATTRLWSWRDEFGDESAWQDVLADLVLTAEAWWPALIR